MHILVGYASANGSTRGVAERLASHVEVAGHSAVVDSVDHVRSSTGYDAVVLGSAIHNGQWLPEADAAVTRLAPELKEIAVWAFSVSSIGATSSTVSPAVARLLRSRTPLPRAVQRLAAISDLRGHRFFAGAIKRGDWPGIGRIVFRLMGGRYGDARDWSDIATYADGIADQCRR